MSCLLIALVLACAPNSPDEGATADGGSPGDGGTDGGSPGDGGGDGGADGGGVSDGGSTGDGGGDGGGPEGDMDADGLPDADETALHGTDPERRDSDGDGQTDAAELAGGSDPLDPHHTIRGAYEQLAAGADGEVGLELELSIVRGDVALIVDTTPSMDVATWALAQGFDAIETTLSDAMDSPAWGFATYEDYAWEDLGQEGSDLPFRLEIALQGSGDSVQGALAAAPIHHGADATASTLEALRQALQGTGYDQACDGVFDPDTDVLPWLASPSDPFGGSAGQAYTGEALGPRGGLGFRDLSLPLLVYATDGPLRDPEGGDASPGGCPDDAGSTAVIAAASTMGARLVGICIDGAGQDQAQDLALATGSLVDTNADGVGDSPAVISTSAMDPDALATELGTLLQGLLGALSWETLELRTQDDTEGLLQGAPLPKDTAGLRLGDRVEFELWVGADVAAGPSDQVFVVPLQLVGDGSHLLAESQLVVVVLGSD